MATKEEIELLLNGRKIVDKYLDDRKVSKDKPPLINKLKADISSLGFTDLDAFYLYDAKLSFLEIADCVAIINRFTGDPEPHCDNCLGREPHWCVETMMAQGMDTACHQRKVTEDISTGDYLGTALITKVLPSDPILDRQKAAAIAKGKMIGNLCTINDVILLWNYNDDESCRCIGKFTMNRKFDFDPFWHLGKMSLPRK